MPKTKKIDKRLLRQLQENLVGTAEAAKILDVERSRIGRWKKADLMPVPVKETAATPIWWKPDIEAMLAERERRRRRGGARDSAAAKKPEVPV